MNDDQAAGGRLQLLDHLFVTDTRRMDVEGCAGLHGFASLCGERVRQISRSVFFKSTRYVIILLRCVQKT